MVNSATRSQSTIWDKMAIARGRPAGFDYMRLILATAVIVQHTVVISYGQDAGDSMFNGLGRVPLVFILPMFFSLSGFLVTGSLERNRSLVSFLGLRAIRLIPALLVETTLSALVLGLIFTSFSFSQYIGARGFSRYFLNIVGDVHYVLPGVFSGNPKPDIVNGQLWTLPYELRCYAALAFAGLIGVAWRKRWFAAFCGVAAAIITIYGARRYGAHCTSIPGILLIESFLLGVASYRLSRRIPASFLLALVAAVSSAILLYVPFGFWFIPMPLTYLTIYIGTLNPRRIEVAIGGDYSYGLYIYGYPIQQAVATFSFTHSWWINLLIAYPLALAFAIGSFWLIEKPAQGLRKYVKSVENLFLKSRVIQWHSKSIFGFGSA